jgi:hypothetical protein
LRDGSVIYGQFVNGTSQNIVFQDENGAQRRFRLNEVQSIDFGAANSRDSGSYREQSDSYNSGRSDSSYRDQYGQSKNNPYNQYNNPNTAYREDQRQQQNGNRFATLPAGTLLSVRTDANINSANAREGETFPATVSQDVMDANGRMVIPHGSDATLIIRRVNEGGTLSNGSFVLDLDSVTLNGRRYMISTSDLQAGDANGIGKNKRTAEMVGGGAVLGTLLGAIAGGGKGAAIGAVAGAAAGGGAEVLTKGHEIRVPAETLLNFRLDRPLELREMR